MAAPHMTAPRWLLLAHQLPARSSNARVKTWRRLQQLGAVASRNSVYVLPNTEQSREDFEWLRKEIIALGGEATVYTADAISESGTEDIVKAFQANRAADYRDLNKQIAKLLATRAKRRGRLDPRMHRAVRSLRDRFDALDRIDFFAAGTRDETATALAELERLCARPAAPAPAAVRKTEYQGRRWVTRHRPGVDRMSSAWLIRRFIDPHAAFAFVDTPVASDVPFDMYAGGFGHRGGLCTYEVLCQDFGIAGTAVTAIGRIVHDLDLKENKYAIPEAAVIGRLVDGLRAASADDAALLEQGIAMFDALARSFEAK
jgi:hypothetical protein